MGGNKLTGAQIARDDAGLSKGYGFVSFSNFEASDDAIANMNGQYLMNKEVSVQYAYKKDGKGERHGDQAERMLAAQARKHNVQPQIQQLPPQLFNTPVPSAPAAMLDGDGGRGWSGAAAVPAGGASYMNGRADGTMDGVPPPQQRRPPPAPSAPLPPPSSGLPARPPPPIGGYAGPQGFNAPGFGAPQPMGAFAPPPGGPPPGMPAPLGFGPPPGVGRGLPPGFGAPPGPLPPGFQQGYGRAV